MTLTMSDPRKGKSIWKRFDKPKGESKVESDGKLYYRIETNLLEWVLGFLPLPKLSGWFLLPTSLSYRFQIDFPYLGSLILRVVESLS